MHFLAVLAIFKNETMNLEEWISHYLWQGVEHFYLIDNGSTDDPQRILDKYASRITYYSRPARHSQAKHYNEVFESIRTECRWLIVADLDEFWYSNRSGTISTLLSGLDESVDVVYAPWRMFGASGHVKHPKSLREDLVHCWENVAQNRKYIIRAERFNTGDLDIHYVRSEKTSLVDLTGEAGFVLNHYPLQSMEFFEKVKMTRGSACVQRHDAIRTHDYFKAYDSLATHKNTELSELVKASR